MAHVLTVASNINMREPSDTEESESEASDDAASDDDEEEVQPASNAYATLLQSFSTRHAGSEEHRKKRRKLGHEETPREDTSDAEGESVYGTPEADGTVVEQDQN